MGVKRKIHIDWRRIQAWRIGDNKVFVEVEAEKVTYSFTINGHDLTELVKELAVGGQVSSVTKRLSIPDKHPMGKV
jgi:hypothetical protein